MRHASLPQAHIVRTDGQLVAPPRAPRLEDPWLVAQARVVAGYAIGLWPLTGVALLIVGFCVLAGVSAGP